MNEFVDECRREWRRLGVPDPVANEMAADLTADLEEAAAEGGTAEDVLGNSAFDPRRFAASWAIAQGVTRPVAAPSRWRSHPVLVGTLAAGLVVLALGAVLVAAVGVRRNSVAMVAHRLSAGPPIRLTPAGPARFGPLGPFVTVHPGNPVLLAGLVLLVLLAGLVVLGALAWSYRGPWSGRRLRRRGDGGAAPWY